MKDKPAPSEGNLPAEKDTPKNEMPSQSKRKKRTGLRLVLLVLIALPLLGCLIYWLSGLIGLSATAKLIELQGVVQNQKPKETRWEPALLNQLLKRQERVRTGANSGAQLLFFDVSTVELDENTEISIEQLAKRRGGSAVDIVLKTWVGKTVVRAVRFVDPSSSLRVDTPTASTVVRGARFSVEVAEDGSTVIDVYEGKAQVQVGDKTVQVTMGEKLTVTSGGQFSQERTFVPNAQPVIDKVTEAWEASGDEFRVELSETEVNEFLTAIGEETEFIVTEAQVWFLEDEARIEAVLGKPVPLDISAALRFDIVEGHIYPDVKSLSAGVSLPIPKFMINPAIDLIMDQVETYLAEAYKFVEFTEVTIADKTLIVVGKKQK
ncbi:MAG: FecR domain-containing protein [Anaerolineae bacterium]|nr:FecR domain-containing protein [Anaerolineae bacterium]